MKLVMFETPGHRDPAPGLLTERGVVSLAGVVERGHTPQSTMQNIIDGFERLRPALGAAGGRGRGTAARPVRLRAPLPRPGKILCCIGNYWEHAQREARPAQHVPEKPGGGGRAGRHDPPAGIHRAVDLHARGRAGAGHQGTGQEGAAQADWRNAVFGYTGLIDVSARGEGRRTWKAGSWLGKSFDTFAPIGPCIATADEIPDPNNVLVRFWNDGQLRHNYNTDDMEHRVPELIEFASTIMTLNSRRPDRLRHQPRGAGRAAGRRDGRDRDRSTSAAWRSTSSTR